MGNTSDDSETEQSKERLKFTEENKGGGSSVPKSDPPKPEVQDEGSKPTIDQSPKPGSQSFHGMSYHTIQPFLPGANFKAYQDRLEQYYIVNQVNETQKVPLFITISGGEVYEILASLTTPDLPSTKSFSVIMSLLNEHFSPKLNKRSERAKFHRIFQHSGETVKEFSIRLQKAAQTCTFGDFLLKDKSGNALQFQRWALDEQLTDQFIIGLSAEKIRQSLINNDPKDYQSCFQLAVNMEMAERESRKIPNQVFSITNRRSVKVKSSSFKRSRSLPSVNPSAAPLLTKCPHCARKHNYSETNRKRFSYTSI